MLKILLVLITPLVFMSCSHKRVLTYEQYYTRGKIICEFREGLHHIEQIKPDYVFAYCHNGAWINITDPSN